MPSEARPAKITAIRTRPLARCSKALLISSMAKTTPASGVLKAAAMPAAEPARISPRSSPMPPARAVNSMMAAPTCTVGPSRPMEAPQASPNSVRRILPKVSRSDSSLSRVLGSRKRRAAMAGAFAGLAGLGLGAFAHGRGGPGGYRGAPLDPAQLDQLLERAGGVPDGQDPGQPVAR